jgi:phosphate transport system permease protein
MESEINIRLALAPPESKAVVRQIKKRDDLSAQPRTLERAIAGVLFFCGAVSILTTIGIVIVLGSEALKFFTTTSWINTNRQTTTAIDLETDTIGYSDRGGTIEVGDLLRIGSTGDEYVTVLEMFSENGMLRVERGARGTPVLEHKTNTAIFRGAEVTLIKYITQTRWAPQIGNFGIRPLMNSTLITSFIAILVALPVGLGAAIYISEYAGKRARSVLKPILELLAGVPTVVYGYFALTFFTPFLRSFLGAETVQVYNMLSPGIVMGIMIIPTISSISEDALNAVPQSLRDASYGLGATKLETTTRILLPAALSGIVASVILGVSRAVGETMIVLIAGGAGPNLTMNPLEAAETMAAHIARIATGDLPVGSIDYNSIFAVGLTLFLMTLILNLISTAFTRRFREVYA